MAFKELLNEELKKQGFEFPLELLPNGYQKVGHVIILNLNPEIKKWEKIMIAEATLELFENVKTVCNKSGGIEGELRTPSIEVLAGEKDTKVEHFENGCWFIFDPQKVMFAKGNISERGRLPEQINEGEVIVDMFVGIGYFTIPIGKKRKHSAIFAIDKNVDSINYLNEGLKKNKIENVETILGDSREEVEKLLARGIKADRVLMGYLPPPVEFMESAFKIVKSGGMIHYDDLIPVEDSEQEIERTVKLFNKIGKKQGKRVELVHAQRVKSYRPKVDHYVLDIRVK